MRWVWGLLLFLCVTLDGRCQNFYDPEVIVNSRGLSDRSQNDLQVLQEQLEYMLLNYAPEVDVDLMPKHPVRVVVSLFVDKAIGEQYGGSVEMAIYRPRFRDKRESLLVFFRQKDMTFDFRPSKTPSLIGRSIPQYSIGKLIYYFATLGAMYYYDSFSLNGGTPFLTYLQSQSHFFQKGLREMTQFASNSNAFPLSPERHLNELQTESGGIFREAWYVYHREGLDSPRPDIYGGVLTVVLQVMKRIRDLDSTSSFLTLFIDAKEPEIRQYFQENKGKNDTRVALSVAEELFPSVMFVR